MRKVLVGLMVAGLAIGACGKKSEEGGSGGSGGGQTLAGFVGGADYAALMEAAKAGAKAAEDGDCDEAVKQGQAAIGLIEKLVPGYGAIGEAAKTDKALSDRMTDLNSARGPLEMATEGCAEEEAGSDIASVYCKQIGEHLGKLAALP